MTLWIDSEAAINDLRLPFCRELPPCQALEDVIKTADVLDDTVGHPHSIGARGGSGPAPPGVAPLHCTVRITSTRWIGHWRCNWS